MCDDVLIIKLSHFGNVFNRPTEYNYDLLSIKMFKTHQNTDAVTGRVISSSLSISKIFGARLTSPKSNLGWRFQNFENMVQFCYWKTHRSTNYGTTRMISALNMMRYIPRDITWRVSKPQTTGLWRESKITSTNNLFQNFDFKFFRHINNMNHNI